VGVIAGIEVGKDTGIAEGLGVDGFAVGLDGLFEGSEDGTLTGTAVGFGIG